MELDQTFAVPTKILEKLFWHLLYGIDSSIALTTTFLNCRLVCRQWHAVATRIMREDSCGETLDTRMYPSPFVAKVSSNIRLNQLNDMIASSCRSNFLPFPCNKFTFIVNFALGHHVLNDGSSILAFLRSFSTEVVEINFILKIKGDAGSDGKISFFKQKSDTFKMPNLETLRFEGICHTFYQSSHELLDYCEGVQNLLETLLGASSNNLRSFKYGFRVVNRLGQRRLAKVVANHLPQCVKHLELSILEMDSIDVKTLISRNLSLESLNVYSASKEFSEFVKSQNAHLNCLAVSGGLGIFEMDTSYSKLKSLKIEGNEWHWPQELHALKNLPFLCSLVVEGYVWKAVNEVTPHPYHGLKHLELRRGLCGTNNLTEDMVLCISQSYPNLESLYVDMDAKFSNSLSQIFLLLSRLKELFIHFPAWGMEGVQLDSLYTGFLPPESAVSEPISLRNLKELEVLGLFEGASLITDVTFQELVRIPNLKKAYFSKSHKLSTKQQRTEKGNHNCSIRYGESDTLPTKWQASF